MTFEVSGKAELPLTGAADVLEVQAFSGTAALATMAIVEKETTSGSKATLALATVIVTERQISDKAAIQWSVLRSA